MVIVSGFGQNHLLSLESTIVSSNGFPHYMTVFFDAAFVSST